MNRTSKIIGGIALLAFGIVWALELLNLININLDGWWALFIIIPCFINIFNDKHKAGSIIGCGIGILLLLAARNVILWADIWKYMICLVAVVWGLALLLFNKKTCCHCHAGKQSNAVVLEGGKMHKIDVSFSKQEYSFDGQAFDGADVHSSFGFVGIDLRNANIADGAVITLDCSFGGIEIRVDKGICVKNDIDTAFAGVECQCNTQHTDGAKTLYLKGHCNFGGIEIK